MPQLKWRCNMTLPDRNGVAKMQQCNLQTTAQRAEDAHAIAEPLVHELLHNATTYKVSAIALAIVTEYKR